ncbi:hypothetical protein [Streptomyces sp. NBC_00696]|uniref:hypothetical protein n=1 Tax=Streptomyces sp. NBC_00696 TaxID=2903672 RepID=UPI002E30A840|nr:hypothetical protein [Streptomyces sp. NBC_00696]
MSVETRLKPPRRSVTGHCFSGRISPDRASSDTRLREFDPRAFLLRHQGHAYRLRGNAQDDAARYRLIPAVWAVGYRFDVTPREEAVRP